MSGKVCALICCTIIGITLGFFSPINCCSSTFLKKQPAAEQRVPNRTHCEHADQKIKPGDYYLDPLRCIVFWCRKAPLRYAEIDQYRCFGLDRLIYTDIYEDCVEHECIMNHWEAIEKYDTSRSRS